MLERLVIGCLWCGGLGFFLMFVFLGFGASTLIPVIMQAIGLFGGFLALCSIIIPGSYAAFVRRRRGRDFREMVANAAKISGVFTALGSLVTAFDQPYFFSSGVSLLAMGLMFSGVFALVLVWQLIFN
jgi:hypothetical protein